MRKRLLFFTLLLGGLLCGHFAHAQIGLSPADTALCPGDRYTITGSFASSYAPNHDDDYFNNSISDIGFPFVYYGDTVTQCLISANNFLTFDLNYVGQHSDYRYTYAVNNGELNNAIMFPFEDIDFFYGGRIFYQTFGSAPNRVFVVQFCEVPFYSCIDSMVTDQVILYEGSNVVEMYITHKPVCLGWQNGTGVEGLRHVPQEDLVPGRNAPSVGWTAVNDGRRFTPNATMTGYTIDTIPYNPIPVLDTSAHAQDIVWYEEGNPNPIHTGSSIDVTVDPNIHYYVASISGYSCITNGLTTFYDTSWVHFGMKYDTLDVNICKGETYSLLGRTFSHSTTFDTTLLKQYGCDTSIHLDLHVNPLPLTVLSDTANGQFFCKGTQGIISLVQPMQGDTYQWYRDGQILSGETSSSITTPFPGDYKVIITTDMGCVDSSKMVHLLVDTVQIDFDINTKFGCGSDTIQIVNNSEPGYEYKWNFGDSPYIQDTTRNPTHVYARQNTYPVKFVMHDTIGCVDSLIKFVTINHPFEIGFTVDQDSLCQGEGSSLVHFTNTSVGGGAYQWNFDDGSPVSNDKDVAHRFTRAGTYNVRLIAVNDAHCFDTAYHLIYVDSLPFLYLNPNKTDLCTGEQLRLQLDYLAITAQKITWSFGDGNKWETETGFAQHSYDKTGNYEVAVTVDYPVCPSETDTVMISVHDLPTVNLGSDTSLCLQGEPITLKNLNGTGGSGTKYLWNTGDTTPSIVVTHPGRYWLKQTVFDCSTKESVMIEKDCYFDRPNAFTPNGDGENDYFLPRQYLSKGVVGFSMSIFNRWGEKIFETHNVEGRGWDGKFNGKPQPMGVYVYQIQVIYKNQRTENYTGNVTLIR